MKKNRVIENTIRKAAVNLKKQIDIFWPAEGNNGFHERNLTFQVAHAFLGRTGTHAFMEVPFFNKKNNRNDLHFDAYVFDKNIGILIECKRLHQIEKSRGIADDLKRMNKTNIRKIMNKHQDDSTPKSLYGLIVAESWKENYNEWWITGKSEVLDWKHSHYRNEMVYDMIEVDKDENLSWLYCYRELSY